MDLFLELNHQTGGDRLYLQIASAIKEHIELGKLQAGQSLPSTRRMAELLGVSRVTVVKSYEHLTSSGHIVSRDRARTFVSTLIERFDAGRASSQPSTGIAPQRQPKGELPLDKWKDSVAMALCTIENEGVECDEFGAISLRRQLAAYLNRGRGANCTPEQILVLSGQGTPLETTLKVLRQRAGTAFVENPADPEILSVYKDALLLPLSPASGMNQLKELVEGQFAYDFELLHCFPTTNPITGQTISRPARTSILEWVHHSQVRFVIEDERNVDTRPGPVLGLQCLQGQDSSGRVLYLGALPHLGAVTGISFVIVPDALDSEFRRLAKTSTLNPPLLEQISLSHYIENGHMERHLYRLRKALDRKRLILVKALKQHFSQLLVLYAPTGNGREQLVRLHSSAPPEFFEIARAEGLHFKPTAPFYNHKAPDREYLISLADMDTDDIPAAVENLARRFLHLT